MAYGDSVEKREKILNHIKDVGKSFPETLAKYDIDVIIAPGDSWLSKYSAALGELCDMNIPGDQMRLTGRRWTIGGNATHVYRLQRSANRSYGSSTRTS